MIARKLHRWLGMVFGLFLLCSAVTGLLWAYAPYLYWKPGYMEKKTALASPPLADTMLSVADALGRLQATEKRTIETQSLLLRRDFGRLLYEIELKVSGEKRISMIDARSGDLLSPLSPDLAVEIARQYVAGNPPVESTVLLSNWVHRNQAAAANAFRVRFQDAGRTEIFLDPRTGRILEDQDRIRRFHFLVMQIHQLNFFGFRKVLTIVSALPLLLMIITGAYLLTGFRIKRRLVKSNRLQKETEKRNSGKHFSEVITQQASRREISRRNYR